MHEWFEIEKGQVLLQGKTLAIMMSAQKGRWHRAEETYTSCIFWSKARAS
jgi:hypothetical protein